MTGKVAKVPGNLFQLTCMRGKVVGKGVQLEGKVCEYFSVSSNAFPVLSHAPSFLSYYFATSAWCFSKAFNTMDDPGK